MKKNKPLIRRTGRWNVCTLSVQNGRQRTMMIGLGGGVRALLSHPEASCRGIAKCHLLIVFGKNNLVSIWCRVSRKYNLKIFRSGVESTPSGNWTSYGHSSSEKVTKQILCERRKSVNYFARSREVRKRKKSFHFRSCLVWSFVNSTISSFFFVQFNNFTEIFSSTFAVTVETVRRDLMTMQTVRSSMRIVSVMHSFSFSFLDINKQIVRIRIEKSKQNAEE